MRQSSRLKRLLIVRHHSVIMYLKALLACHASSDGKRDEWGNTPQWNGEFSGYDIHEHGILAAVINLLLHIAGNG